MLTVEKFFRLRAKMLTENNSEGEYYEREEIYI